MVRTQSRTGESLRPEKIVLVCGTGTEVGKTWVGAQLLGELRSRGLQVAARKPAQSFDVDSEGTPLGGATDAEVLGAASGQVCGSVCHPFRSYHRAMAPPMAAEALGLPPFTLADLIEEMVWPDHRVDVGLVEAAGGVMSPQASDGDSIGLLRVLLPDIVLLVADAGLGTINAVRLSMAPLLRVVSELEADPVTGRLGKPIPIVVVLDRFAEEHYIHQRNLKWLTSHHGFEIVTLPGMESALGDILTANH